MLLLIAVILLLALSFTLTHGVAYIFSTALFICFALHCTALFSSKEFSTLLFYFTILFSLLNFASE